MRFFAILRIAHKALLRNKLRTFLTMLGIIIGVGSVIAMVSFGNGAKAQVEEQISNMGRNIIMIFAGNFRRGGASGGAGSAGTMKIEDADAILHEVPGVVAVSPEVNSSGQIIYGNQNWSASVYGVSPDYLQIRRWELASGDMFSQQHLRSAAKVVLLGTTVVTELFGEGNDPVGARIRIGAGKTKVPFLVIGALEPKGTTGGSDYDNRLLVPYTTAMKRLSGGRSIRRIHAQAQAPEMMEQIEADITALLRQRHHIRDDRDDDFMIRTQEEIRGLATETSTVMTTLLGAIASVSLLVGGIGIMNIMLVSVTERTREIGIRMSVGAKSNDILLQFLTEAIVLSVLGGAIGIAAGIGTSTLLGQHLGWASKLSESSVFIAFFFSAAIGVFFGFYPARKAAQLDPIESLRYE